ncbi:hypothetical protein TNCV_4732941 [Trichonephila clavipes]|nr:hypothetical protein TNCV_4732941 [Trichonephila clavipes]
MDIAKRHGYSKYRDSTKYGRELPRLPRRNICHYGNEGIKQQLWQSSDSLSLQALEGCYQGQKCGWKTLLLHLIRGLVHYDVVCKTRIHWKRRFNTTPLSMNTTLSPPFLAATSSTFVVFFSQVFKIQVLTEFLDDIPLAAKQRLWFQHKMGLRRIFVLIHVIGWISHTPTVGSDVRNLFYDIHVRQNLHCRPRVTMPNEDRYLAVTAKRNRRSTASDLSRQLSSATVSTASRQTVYRRLGQTV